MMSKLFIIKIIILFILYPYLGYINEYLIDKIFKIKTS